MLISYVDETGDTGDPALTGSTGCFGLGCVLIESARWNDAFDRLVSFRRALRADFGIRMRTELKANVLIRASGGLRPLGLSPTQRGLIYRYHLNTLEAVGARAFAVVVDKRSAGVTGRECLDLAWETLLQRLERTTSQERTDVMVIHDFGENDELRRIMRRARRHLTAGRAFGPGSTTQPLRRLVEDPVPRQSHESYFLQLADMVAYAGWRSHVPPSAAVQAVTGADLWSAIGPATHRAVNSLSKRGAPGVVLRY